MNPPPRHLAAAPAGVAPAAGPPHRRSARRLIARLLTVAGCCLIGLALAARLASIQGSEAGLDRFRAAQAAQAWLAIEPDRSLWAEGRIAKYEESLRDDLGLPLAVMRIPRLALEVPLWPGVDERTLNRGLGQIPGTAAPGGSGNTGIAGHRDGFFRVLEGIALGDRIELETLAGVERFEVVETRIVPPTEVGVLDPTTERTLTLVTCFPFYFVGKAPERFIVRARAGDVVAEPAAVGSSDAASGSSVP